MTSLKLEDDNLFIQFFFYIPLGVRNSYLIMISILERYRLGRSPTP